MRLCAYLALVVSALHIVTSQVPDVYDFCNALFHNQRIAGSSRTGCGERCPQGAPGKRGPEGRTGPPGQKGDQGEEGTCDTLKARIDKLQSALSFLALSDADTLVRLCGLGMKSGTIPDTAISATSHWDLNWVASKGRLDHPTHCWHARPSEVGQYIQIDLGKPTVITGVVTQGRPGVAQWVKSYKIACAINLHAETWSMDDGVEKVFTGNTDSGTKVANFLTASMSCRYIRLYPQSWNGAMCMRMELLGEHCLSLMP